MMRAGQAPRLRVDSYLRMHKNHQKMIQINAPEVIIQSGKEMLSKMAEKLKSEYGFDVIKFMDTPQGQEEYHRVLINEHSFEKSAKRCHICKAFTIHNGCKKGVMSKDDAYPVVCKEFEDSGFSNDLERIQTLMDRCEKCIHCQYDDEEGYTCKKNLDMDEVVCTSMEKKDDQRGSQ